MLIVIGVVAGLVGGLVATGIWGLRKAQGVGPELLLVGLVLFSIAFFWGAEKFGWPTPGSIAASTGAVTDMADRWLLAGIELLTGVLVVAVLVRSGVTLRLHRWSRRSE